MEASQNHLPHLMKEDGVSPECQALISSLPLDRDFLGHNLCNYQGCWYYYNTLQAVLDVQTHFRPKDTDIILASFPKAGTTWLKSLTFAILRRGNYHKTPETHPLLHQNPHSLVPFLEFNLYYQRQIPDLEDLASPRLFSTHIPFLTLQETMRDSTCKVVYVCRNIKDTMVSDWHFRSKLERRDFNGNDLNALFDSFCKGVHFYGPFWDHALSYWNQSLENPKQVLFMKYEEIKRDPRGEIKRLANFLGHPFTEEEEKIGMVDEILKLCSFGNLSNLEVNKTKVSKEIEGRHFYRKGDVGDWKNHLTSEMTKKMDEIIEMKLQGSTLKFD